MNVHYKWMVVLALAASPMLSHAGPNKDNDNDKDDRPGHSHDSGSHDSDRGLNQHYGPSHDDHGRNGDNDCHHRHGDGWVNTHLGDHNNAGTVPDSGSSAILLGGTLLGFLALSRTFQPKLATAKIRRATRSR